MAAIVPTLIRVHNQIDSHGSLVGRSSSLKTAMLLSSATALMVLISAQYARAQETTSYEYDMLGRLVRTDVSGGANNGVIVGACFDTAGNRSVYFTGTSGAPACVPGGGQTPTPTPSNTPPVAVDDTLSQPCHRTGTKDLTANDTDADGDYPLVLQSITRLSGESVATIVSSSTIRVDTGTKGPTTFTYVVRDSRGAVSSAGLKVTSTGTLQQCEGGIGP